MGRGRPARSDRASNCAKCSNDSTSRAVRNRSGYASSATRRCGAFPSAWHKAHLVATLHVVLVLRKAGVVEEHPQDGSHGLNSAVVAEQHLAVFVLGSQASG